MKKLILAIGFFLGVGSAAWCQSDPTALRLGDLQIGAGYTTANSDYTANRIAGFAFYSDFDFRAHYGAEVEFHQLHSHDPAGAGYEDVYERTYEAGVRYVRHYNLFNPYVKVLYGRGVFNFPYNEANLAYNMLVGGGGVDIPVHPRVNVRADFEYQNWFGFPPNGLTPSLITIGVAYHFPAGRPH